MPHAKVEPGHVGVPGLGVEVAAGLAGAAVAGQHGGDDLWHFYRFHNNPDSLVKFYH